MEIGGGTMDGRPVGAKNDMEVVACSREYCTAQELNKMANKGGNQVYRGNGC